MLSNEQQARWRRLWQKLHKLPPLKGSHVYLHFRDFWPIGAAQRKGRQVNLKFVDDDGFGDSAEFDRWVQVMDDDYKEEKKKL